MVTVGVAWIAAGFVLLAASAGRRRSRAGVRD
jgi:hypothetical protein